MQSTSSPGSTPPRKTANAATMCCPPPGTNTKACPNTWPPPKAAWTATSKKPAALCKTTPTFPNPPPPGPSYDDLRPLGPGKEAPYQQALGPEQLLSGNQPLLHQLHRPLHGATKALRLLAPGSSKKLLATATALDLGRDSPYDLHRIQLTGLGQRLRGNDRQLRLSIDLSSQHRNHILLAVCAQLKGQDRKSTRLNSSHVRISYAVFCLKKKKKQNTLP